LAAGLIGLLVVACGLMLQQLWQLHQEGSRWRQLPNLHDGGLPLAGESIQGPLHCAQSWRGQALPDARHAQLQTRLSRLAEHHEQRLQVSALLAGLTVGLGLLATLYGLFNALGEMPLPTVPGHSYTGLGAALAAAVFTALAAFCLGALLLAVSSASNRLHQMRLITTRSCLEQECGCQSSAQAPEPPAQRERPATTPVEQCVLELVQSVRRLSADLDNQNRTTNRLLARMETLPEQAPSGCGRQSLPTEPHSPQKVVLAARAEAPDHQAEARQRINKLQRLLGELQVSNEYILARLATSSRTPPTPLG
jgi:hypothetical protein